MRSSWRGAIVADVGRPIYKATGIIEHARRWTGQKQQPTAHRAMGDQVLLAIYIDGGGMTWRILV